MRIRFVVDTNILVSATIKNSLTRAILLHPAFQFLTPEYALQEMEEHYTEIRSKTGLSDGDCRILINTLVSAVIVVPRKEFEDYMPEARQVMKEIDENDTSFLALAMSFANYGIWSDDLDFQRQHMVRVWRTNDLIELL